ncbi:MAG: alpha-amylase family glycosyl hydrolase [Pseudomonadota bacterium]
MSLCRAIVVVSAALVLLACDPPPEPPPSTVVDANFNPRDAAGQDSAAVDGATGQDVITAHDAASQDTSTFLDAGRDASSAADAAAQDSSGHDAGPGADAAASSDASTEPDASAGNDAASGVDGASSSDAATADAGSGQTCETVTFVFNPGASAATILVAGDFNGWAASVSAGAWAMSDPESDGTWTATRALSPGLYQYKFIVDGNWQHDPSQPTVQEGNNINNLLTWRGCTASCPGEFDWRDAVMYFALVDRFFDSDNQADPVADATDGDATTGPSGQYEGGDLAGVTDKMSYLADLGVTALWISAPYENRNTAGDSIDPQSDSRKYSAYHGYWPSPASVDFSDPYSPTPPPAVETRIGDETDLRDLIAAAHGAQSADGHGIKVLFDYVMNHVDKESGLYAQHDTWFVPPWDGTGSQPPGAEANKLVLCQPGDLWNDSYWGTRCAFTSYLPAFDFYNPLARGWSINDALWWAAEYGIDGYRLDAIKHVPLSWLTELRTRLTTDLGAPSGDRFYLVGETFDYYNRDTLKTYIDPSTMLDGQFDFPFKRKVCEALFASTITMNELSIWMGGNDTFYGRNAIMTTWIGNHDIPRAIHFAERNGQLWNSNPSVLDCGRGSNAANGWSPQNFVQPTAAEPYQRLALAYAVMMTSPGIPLIYYGDEIGLAGGGDPDNRRMMNWASLPSSDPREQLRSTVRKLAHLRAQHHALSRGFRLWISSDDDTWVYRMTGCGEQGEIVVAINRADADRQVTLPAGSYDDLMADPVTTRNGGLTTLPARSFLVLRPH